MGTKINIKIIRIHMWGKLKLIGKVISSFRREVEGILYPHQTHSTD